MKKIYMIRHCEAEGQPSDSPLTDKGLIQTIDLLDFFSDKNVDRIISSPYLRAIQSIQPLAKEIDIEIEIDSRLIERVLSTNHLTDWFEKLRLTFDDIGLKFEGGESSHEAMTRIVEVVEDVFNSETNHAIIVTHGNLLSLLLKYFNKNVGFDDWQNMSNPDVFLLTRDSNKVTLERIWKTN